MAGTSKTKTAPKVPVKTRPTKKNLAKPTALVTAGASTGIKPKVVPVSKPEKETAKVVKARKAETKKAAKVIKAEAKKEKTESRKIAREAAAQLKEKARKEKAIKKKVQKQAREKVKLSKKASEKAQKLARERIRKQDKVKSKIVYESRMQRLEAVHYFEALTTGLKKGAVQFKQGDDTVIVTPSELVDVEILAKTKGRKEMVIFELSWISEKASDISISSK